MVRAPGSKRADTASKNTTSGSQRAAVDVSVVVRSDDDIERIGGKISTQDSTPDYISVPEPKARHLGFNFVMPQLTWLAGAILIGIAIKAYLLMAGAAPFNSDEAVVALMARHILAGARPLFFYGQAYMGSLDAWLAAGAFTLFGEQVLAVRLVQVLLFVGYLFTLWLLGRSLFVDRLTANLAIVLAAVPTVLVTTYTTVSLGGYAETLVLGNLILWLGYQVTWGKWGDHRWAWPVLGLVSGLAFWTLALSVVYLLPVGILIVWQAWQNRPGAGADNAFTYEQAKGWDQTRRINRLACWILALAGFFLGSLPWWYANLTGSWAAMRVLVEASSTQTSFGERLVSLLLLGLPAVAGMRFPWSPEFSPLPVLFLYLVFYLAIVFTLVTRILASAMLSGASPLSISGASPPGMTPRHVAQGISIVPGHSSPQDDTFVIARRSLPKQSPSKPRWGLLRRYAPRNDGPRAILSVAKDLGQPAEADHREHVEGQDRSTQPLNSNRSLAPGAGMLLLLYAVAFLVIYLSTRFGIDSTGRYLLPLNLLLVYGAALFLAIAWRRKQVWGVAFLVLILALNAYEIARASISSDGLTTQFDPRTRFDNRHDAALMDFLSQKGELRGYSNYWVSFRLAFLSEEELIYAPLLPYKPDLSYAPGDNRYPAYAHAAAESPRVAYITSLQPDFDALLRRELASLGVGFEEQQIGPYHIFYHLTRPVHPRELQWQDSP